jgi:3'-phosphoadenosine 5'-phosphosulfate sulfotransferase (PAPS reductase)/FAD synthetase
VAMRASEAAIAGLGAPGAILLLTGELRAESASRSKKPAWQLRAGPTAPTLGRLVVWHRMILDWSKADIWQYLVERGIPVPTSYREGFARHSCVHCIHKGWHEIVLAFALYPEGAARRVAAEERMGHRVRLDYQWGEYVGYRAAWEFVYGPWEGAYLGAPVRDEARAQIAAWQASGRYFAPPPGVVWAD